MTRRKAKAIAALVCAGFLLASCGDAETGAPADQPDPSLPALQPEQMSVVTLAERMEPDWVFVTDGSFDRPLDGRAMLVDLTSGRVLGMVSGGFNQAPLMIDPDGRSFAQISTYFSRGSRGERTDVLTEYAMSDLAPGRETVVPAKFIKAMLVLASARLTDDGRFALLTNFTPQQSITVVDRESGAMVGEFQTPGCGLVYPVGARRFMVHCSDGSLKLATLDDGGAITLGEASEVLSPLTDPVNEKPVRIGRERWLFTTFSGQAVEVDGSGDVPQVVRRWSLSGGEDDEGWVPGGLQPMAYHRASNRVFVLMHEGGQWTHKDPGTQVWVYDLKSRKRTSVLALEGPATSVAVTPGAEPRVLTTMFGGSDALAVYELSSGEAVASIGELGQTLATIQTLPEVW